MHIISTEIRNSCCHFAESVLSSSYHPHSIRRNTVLLTLLTQTTQNIEYRMKKFFFRMFHFACFILHAVVPGNMQRNCKEGHCHQNGQPQLRCERQKYEVIFFCFHFRFPYVDDHPFKKKKRFFILA